MKGRSFIIVAIGALLLNTSCDSYDILSNRWQGKALCYSGYRSGQNPLLSIYPTQDQIKEDLRILAKNWRLIRVYGSDQHSSDILEVIKQEKIKLKVMLGAWLDGEPGNELTNVQQIKNCIRLANAFSDIVIAVNVGNEALVNWSNHKVPEENVIRYVKLFKDSVPVPVTVADDFIYWRDNGAKLAEIVDFITMHTYPIWGREDIDKGFLSTVKHYETIKKAYPNKKIIIGEVGWATYTIGDLHAPKAGDDKKQKLYYDELMAWAEKDKITVFFFEAFDEPWKGTGTEGHWGLFSVDRKAKLAIQGLYPELMPSEPTSPGYDK